MFQGYLTALITPFRGGEVDEDAYRDFVTWQIEEGAAGLVPCGTTGESPTLTHDEHRRVTEICIETAGGRVPVVAGTGSNSTEEAISLTHHAKEAGADGALLVMPYYNKPSQEGMYAHYKAINDAVDIPQIIYNIPGRSVVDMSIETMARLAALPNIVGVKDATADLARPTRMNVAVEDEFCQLSGEDGTALSFLAQGGDGCISVTANVAPRQCAGFFAAWERGDAGEALDRHTQLMPLHDVLFVESNPTPIKYAVSLLGKCAPDVRLPLTSPGQANRERIETTMRRVGLLN